MKNSDGSSRRYDELSHQISMQREPTGPRAMVTQDHDLIRHWAEKHRAEPRHRRSHRVRAGHHEGERRWGWHTL